MTSFRAIQFTKVRGKRDTGGEGNDEFSFRTGEPEMFIGSCKGSLQIAKRSETDKQYGYLREDC